MAEGLLEEIGRISFIRMKLEEWKETDPLLENKTGFLDFIEASEPGKVRVKDTEAWLKYQKEARRKRVTVSEMLFDKARAAIPLAKRVAKKERFQAITICPLHLKPVYIILEAPGLLEAREKALGMEVTCPWGGLEETHKFRVEKVLGVSPFPWRPESSVSAVPIVSSVVKEITTTSLGERFWILSKRGQDEYKKIGEEVEAATTLTPVPTTKPSRGAAPVGGVILIALIVIVVSYGLYRKFKK